MHARAKKTSERRGAEEDPRCSGAAVPGYVYLQYLGCFIRSIFSFVSGNTAAFNSLASVEQGARCHKNSQV